jgi:hypothetical protein
MLQDPESARLEEARTVKTPWRKWGPYLSERQWGTVREDYSQVEMPGTTSLVTGPGPAPITVARMVLLGVSDDKQFPVTGQSRCPC